MATTRTFVAVPAAADVREEAAGLIRQWQAEIDAKWVEPQNLHWTLYFLGEVEDLEIPAVCRQVAQAAASHRPFLLQTGGVGAFPNPRRPRTLWLAAREGSEAMVGLQAAIQQALEPLGFRGEQRRFQPHLTLGRAAPGRDTRSLAGLLDRYADFSAGSMPVEQVTVYASQLSRSGPVYHVLGTARLGG